MKKFCLVFASLLFVVLPSSATTLSFTSVQSTVQKGTKFMVDVHIAGAVDLVRWEFDVGFDPTVLHAFAVAGGDFLSGDSTPTYFLRGVIDNEIGVIDGNWEWIADSEIGKSGDGRLASFGFIAVAEGVSPLTLFYVGLTSTHEESVDFDIELSSITVTPAPIPEPATALFVFGGLAALGCLRRKRRV